MPRWKNRESRVAGRESTPPHPRAPRVPRSTGTDSRRWRLLTLGGLGLRGPGGLEPRFPVSGARRLGILIYLSGAREGCWVSREEVMALLNPEGEVDHARHALRQALHELRHMLPPETILRHPTAGLRLNRAVLESDLVEFEEACATKDWEGAVRLYGGDFVPGFSIPGARDFQRWLDRRRLGLIRKAEIAGWQLAGRRRDAGDRPGAVTAAEWAAGWRPLDELTAERMIAFLTSLDAPAEAARWFDGFCRRLRDELGVDPTSSLTRLAGSIIDDR